MGVSGRGEFARAVAVAAVALVCVVAGSSLADDERGDGTMQPVMETPRDLRCEFDGYLREYLQGITENWLVAAPARNPMLLDMIRNRNREPFEPRGPWDGEFPGKHLTGAVEVYRLHRDPDLRAAIEGFVAELVSLQDASGYLGVWPDAHALSGRQPDGNGGTWDTWNHYHIMLGLIAWYEESGDEAALRAATRIADLMCERFLGKPGSVVAIGTITTNLAPAHALCLLHRITGDSRYLALAHQIIDHELARGGSDQYPRAVDLVNRALEGQAFWQTNCPWGSRWELMHTLMALPELYWLDGEGKYRQAFEHIWWSMVESDRHNNGGWGSMETAVGNPYEMRSLETCCMVAWAAMSVDMLRLTGNSVVADELELGLLNFALGFWARDGGWSSYNPPMDGRRIPSVPSMNEAEPPMNTELCCCSVNAPRGLGLLSRWALMTDAEGLVLNWYGPGTLAAAARGTTVALEQHTDYPRTGRIEIVVRPEQPVECTLKLRIPHWSRQATQVSVNGEPQSDVRPGAYYAIRRTWNPGDRIELVLDMSPHFWVGERECAGRTSIYHGPLLLALPRRSPKDYLEFAGEWKPYVAERSLPYAELWGSDRPGDSVSFRFEGEEVAWQFNRFDNCGTARVTIDGQDKGVVDLYAPVSDKSLWVYSSYRPNIYVSESVRWGDLGPGEHTLTITVLDEKNPGSTGRWVNVREFVTPAGDPVLDARTLQPKVVESDQGFPIVAVEVRDAQGRAVRLWDFASAGEQQNPYISWLRVENAPATPFSRTNPLRSGTLAAH